MYFVNKNNMFFRNFGVLVTLLIFVVAVPVLLNFMLQLNSPCDSVIGGDKGPIVWLAFWGTYIGAIGSILIAFVSYFQSRSESERMSVRTQLEHERNLYNKLEQLIEKNVSIHSICRIYEIKSAYNVNMHNCEVLMSKLRADLYLASLNCVTFNNIVLSNEYKQYGTKLATLNMDVIDIVNNVSVCDLTAIDMMLEQMKNLQKDIADLINLGFNVLKKQNDVIISLEKRLQKIKSPLWIFNNPII